jgi:hypothetical protein
MDIIPTSFPSNNNKTRAFILRSIILSTKVLQYSTLGWYDHPLKEVMARAIFGKKGLSETNNSVQDNPCPARSSI